MNGDQTIEDFDALEQLRRDLAEIAGSVGSADEAEPPPHGYQRPRVLVLAAAVVVLLAATVAVFALVTDAEDGSPVITDSPSTTTIPDPPTTTTSVEPAPDPTVTEEIAPVELHDLPVIDIAADVSLVDADVDTLVVAVQDGVVVRSGSEMLRIDQATETATSLASPILFNGAFAAEGELWFLSAVSVDGRLTGENELRRLDLDSGSDVVVRTYPGGGSPVDAPPRLVSAAETFWVVYVDPEDGGTPHADRIDPADGSQAAMIDPPDPGFVAGAGALWSIELGERTVRRVDAETGAVAGTLELPAFRASAIASPDSYRLGVTSDAVWAISDSVIYRIDPDTTTIVATIPQGYEISSTVDSPDLFGTGFLVGDTLFVADHDDSRRLYRIDPGSNTVAATLDLGAAMADLAELAVAGDTVWFRGSQGLARVPVAALERTESAPRDDENLELDPDILVTPAWQDAIDNRVDIAASMSSVDATIGGEIATTSGLDGDANSVWVSTGNRCPCELVRLDATTGEVTASVEFDDEVTRPVAEGGSVWFTSGGRLYQVDASTAAVVTEVLPSPGRGFMGGIALGEDALWALTEDQFFPFHESGAAAVRVDPTSGAVEATIELGDVRVGASRPVIAAAEGAVWVGGDGMVQRIDPATDAVVATIALPDRLTGAVLAGDDTIWVMAGSLYRIDPATNRVVASIAGPPPGELALNWPAVLTDSGLIVGNWQGRLFKFGLETEEPPLVFELGPWSAPSTYLAVVGDELWLAEYTPQIVRMPLAALEP